MVSKQQLCNSLFHKMSRATMAALTMAVTFALAVVLTPSAQAQTLTVLHNFTGGGDGANPQTGLTIDAAGNLYGTTWAGGGSKCGNWGTCGGVAGCGTVFKLKHSGSGWVLNTLYGFTGSSDGACPWTKPALAKDGTLYGTTWAGGGNCSQPVYGCGTVFQLRPSPAAPKTALAPWSETVIHAFTGTPDGQNPEGDLTFDPSGNIYGTTFGGGNQGYGCAGCGAVYKLTLSGGGWTETVLYSPPGDGTEGAFPVGGVVFDKSSNLYGVFSEGDQSGTHWGTVYELSPSGSGWVEQMLYAFTNGDDGSDPSSVIIDSAGNLYGTTAAGAGTVFELTPGNGGWTFTTLYHIFHAGENPEGPLDRLLMDAAGNLYGTTLKDYEYGTVFKLAPSNGGWTYTQLYAFTGGSDGKYPYGGVVMDANGNLYGTTSAGGAYGNGVVWELTP